MKRLILFMALIASVCVFQAKAQTLTRGKGYFPNSHGVVKSPPTSPTFDTVSTVAKSQILYVTDFYDDLLLQVNVLPLTGSPTSGSSAKLYGGMDGVNFPYPIKIAIGDTLAVSGTGLKNYIWDVGQSKFPYYKITYTPYGTQTTQIYSQFQWSRFTRVK